MYFFRATITDASFSFSVHKNLNRWKNSPPFFPTIFQLKLCFSMLFYAFPIKKKPLKRIGFQWFALFCITNQRRRGDYHLVIFPISNVMSRIKFLYINHCYSILCIYFIFIDITLLHLQYGLYDTKTVTSTVTYQLRIK